MRVEANGHGLIVDEKLTPGEARRRIPADGPAARRRHRARALYRALRPRARSASASRSCATKARWRRPPNGRLRVTPSRLPAARRGGRRSRVLTSPARTTAAPGSPTWPPLRRHPQHRQPALVGAVGAEAEHAVDAGKARGIGQHLLAEALRRLASSPARRPAPPRHRRASRCAPDPGRSGRDNAPRNCGSRSDPAPAYQPPSSDGSVKMRWSSHRPVPSSCTRFKLTPSPASALHHLRHRVGAVGNEDRCRPGRPPAPRAAPARPSCSDRADISPAPRRGRRGAALPAGTPPPPPRHRHCPAAARRTSACRARRRIRRCAGRRSPAGSSADKRRALATLASVENAITGMLRWRATCADRAHRLREQRADDDLGALVDRLLRAGLRALRRAGVVLHQQLDVRVLEFGERDFRGVLHRLSRRRRHCPAPTAAGSGRRGSGPAPSVAAGAGSGARRRRVAEEFGIAAGAGAEHRGGGGKAKRRAHASSPARQHPRSARRASPPCGSPHDSQCHVANDYPTILSRKS